MKKMTLKELFKSWMKSWMKTLRVYCPPGIGFVLDPLYPRFCEPFWVLKVDEN